MLIFALNFVGKRIKTNPQTLDFTRLFRFVLIILYSHTFATNAIAGGMDVKTLSTVIGHVSAATTLDIYAHSTEAMQKAASLHIDQGIAHQAIPPQPPKEAQPSAPFQPYKGKKRKPGTGGLTQITHTLWEGRYAPVGTDGKRHVQTVYAKIEAECEVLLAELIAQHKAS